MPPAAIAIGGAALGGIAGAMGKKSEQSTSSGINLSPATALENQANGIVGSSLGGLNDLTNAGPGQSDVTGATDASRQFAALLQQLSQTGGLPGQQDITASNGIAQNLFQAQRVQQQQQYQQAGIDTNRQAAIMGRGANDPILQAKLQQENMRQQQMINANQGVTAQQLALQLPGQRAQYAGQAVDVLGGLATQAFKNRAALLSAGSDVQNQERQFRLNTGERYSNSTEQSGGGLGGAISGALGGAGAGLSIASGIGGLFGAGGSAGVTAGGGMNLSNLGGFSAPSFGQSAMSNFGGPAFGNANQSGGRTTLLGRPY